ncbi:MAG: hypothetical protein ABI361_08585 [Nitrososphaera sp.]|jgi:hypothetical protein
MSTYEKELASWANFSVFLKNENRQLFKQMLSETEQFLPAFNAKEQMPQEAFLMTVILANQRMIAELEEKVARRKQEAREKGSLDYYLRREE